jgi:hypothetical protein
MLNLMNPLRSDRVVAMGGALEGAKLSAVA